MAPKKQPTRKRIRQALGQSSNAPIEPNWNLEYPNRYLFRDIEAYENYVGAFQERKLCECYFFDKSQVTFSTREDNKILEYIAHWGWEPLLTCNEPYMVLTTRLFYTNLRSSENPFRMTSWLCGKEIRLSLTNVAEWLNIPNEGEEVYILRNWPRGTEESAEYYKKWFNRGVMFGASIYATPLPSLHRLLFLFVNNILTPKAAIKTNIEFGAMYYLRHLIQKDTTLNIPFVILSHMQASARSRVALLPYAHLIHKIMRLNDIEIVSDDQWHSPQNLVNHLTKIGWVVRDSPSGLPQYRPDGRDINDWIHINPDIPNQYWDPARNARAQPQQQEQQAQQQTQPQFQSQFQPQDQPQYHTILPLPPIPNTSADQLTWICQRLQDQHMFNGMMHAGLQTLQRQYQAQDRLLSSLDERQAFLSRRFTQEFGPSTSSFPTNDEEEEEAAEDENEEDEDEEVEEEDERDNMDD